MDSKLINATFYFQDGSYYTVREGGDTIMGIMAHKVMYKVMDAERANKMTVADRCKFIIENSDKILKP